MIRKVLFLIVNIYVLLSTVGATAYHATELDNGVAVRVKSQDPNLDGNETVIEHASSEVYHPKCTLSESSNEDDPSDVSSKNLSPIPTLTFYNQCTAIDRSIQSKSKIQRLLQRNMTPVQNVSRTILFHTLQTHF